MDSELAEDDGVNTANEVQEEEPEDPFIQALGDRSPGPAQPDPGSLPGSVSFSEASRMDALGGPVENDQMVKTMKRVDKTEATQDLLLRGMDQAASRTTRSELGFGWRQRRLVRRLEDRFC